MTKEYINRVALDVIMERQADTKMNADRDDLLYLMAFNDGVIELTLNLLQAENKAESEET